VPELEWYWYVPRALRNNAYVFFVNTANRYPGRPEPGADPRPRHGHSAVIAPDGTLVAAESGDMETILYVEIDPDRATRAGALERRAHPLLGRFWGEGFALLKRPRQPEGAFTPLDCPETELSVGVAQLDGGDWAQLAKLVDESPERLDLLAVAAAPPNPEAAAALARERRLTLVYLEDALATVVGPDGEVLARHRGLADGGADAATMWFRVKGVPAVVTTGRDALWNEVAELAAFAGARLHVHLTSERAAGRAAQLRRRQIGAALSSFFTLTVMAAPAYSAVWEDLAGAEETRAAVRGEPRPEGAPVRIYSPFSANLAAEAGTGPELIAVRRGIPGPNPYARLRAGHFQPAMEAWYRFGSRLLCPLLELKRE
jgi:predicted amidohydrolase